MPALRWTFHSGPSELIMPWPILASTVSKLSFLFSTADWLKGAHVRTEEVPQGLLDKVTLGEGALVFEDEFQVDRIVDDDARGQARDIQLEGLMAEDTLALGEPGEEFLTCSEEQYAVPNKWECIWGFPGVQYMSEKARG